MKNQKNNYIDKGGHSPLPGNRTGGEAVAGAKATLVASLLFLLFQYLVVGLIPAQVLMVVLFNLFFFAHPLTRKMAVGLLPFILFEMCYDWMRLYPNYLVNPVDTQGIYEAELSLFGIASEGTVVIPCQYFTYHHTAAIDLLSGLFYLLWVPGPMAFGLWLFFKGERRWFLRFSLAFLVVNLVGFAGYYIHPTAPPWYVLEHGFEPDFHTPGNVAGLGRFDQLVGIPVFQSIYVNNSNIFAAVPSLHSAYMLVATVYAVLSRQSRWLVAVCTLVAIGIWWTAVYTCHHYIIDVLLGIATGLLGIALFELVLLRIPAFQRFFNRYAAYIG